MRALAVAGCGVIGAGACGCESTEQESAKLAGEGQRIAASQGALRLGAPNRALHISNVILLSGEGRTAVALRLTSSSSRPQASVPLLVEVTGPHGKTLYSNATGGLEASLQRAGGIPARASVWWVDDQVLGAQPGSAVSVRAGTGTAPRSLPALPLSGVHQSQSAGQSVVAGSVRNGTGTSLERVPVYAVALRGGRPVAAGRAVVESLPGHRTASFQIFMVGSPAGAQLAVQALPPPA